jgi:hypothetical protein
MAMKRQAKGVGRSVPGQADLPVYPGDGILPGRHSPGVN